MSTRSLLIPALTALAFIIGGSAAAQPPEPTDWPTWRGALRDGKSPDTGLLKEWPKDGPKLLWTFENAGKGYSSPALVGGKIYLTGSRGGKAEIICLDSGGKELWSAPIGADPEKGYNTGWGAGTRGAPTVSDGMVFAMSANGELACFDTSDGKRLWNKDLVKDFGGGIPDWGYSESPLVDGDKVVVTPGGDQGAIVALDKKTGKELWRSKDLKDGAQYSSLVVAEDVWENKVMKNHHGGVVLVDGHIYGFSDGGGLVCQELATGKQKWSQRGEGSQKGAVHYADGMLYCMDEEAGSVFLAEANPDKYIEHGRFEIPRQTKLREGTNGKVWTHPVVIGGKLYLRDQDLLFCYDVKS